MTTWCDPSTFGGRTEVLTCILEKSSLLVHVFERPKQDHCVSIALSRAQTEKLRDQLTEALAVGDWRPVQPPVELKGAQMKLVKAAKSAEIDEGN